MILGVGREPGKHPGPREARRRKVRPADCGRFATRVKRASRRVGARARAVAPATFIIASTIGCAASVRNVSAQQTGCAVHDIEISEHYSGAGNETWVVTCGEHVFDCVRPEEPFRADVVTVGGPLLVEYRRVYGTMTGETLCLLREE